MTNYFEQKITCPFCRNEITLEDDHNRWMREQELLDSWKHGFVLTNCDHIIVRWKRPWVERLVQTMMIVEVKTYGKRPDKCQEEILGFFSDTMPEVTYPFSRIADSKIKLVTFGSHLLQYENSYIRNSTWFKWDGHVVDKDLEVTLLKILRMDVLPHDIDASMDDYLRSLKDKA
jgi:hypothetical protein